MFLTPDQTPFFGGTYFPKTARHGMPGFIDLLPHIAAVYRTSARRSSGRTSHCAALVHTLPPPAAAPLLFGQRRSTSR